MSDKIEKKVQEALGRHDRGYNCSQSVACTFCDELGFDEETMFRITEGMGLGMGSMDGTCGAIGAAAVLAGMKTVRSISIVRIPRRSPTKPPDSV